MSNALAGICSKSIGGNQLQNLYVEIPGQIAPFESPFDNPGYPPDRCQFVYLTNRGVGRYSGLLPIDFDWNKLGWGIAEYFPQGYTNLLRLEKIYTAHPDLDIKSEFKVDNRSSPRVYKPKGFNPARSSLNKWSIGNLFVALREPVSCGHLHDIIGEMYKSDRAVNMAKRYANTFGRRAVVGQMVANLTWH